MTNKEVNKIITEYMKDEVNDDCRHCGEYLAPDYTESLDRLFPVLKKLQPKVSLWINYSSAKPYAEATVWNMTPKYKQSPNDWDDFRVEKKSDKISFSAAYVVAKAIQELDK